MQQSQVPSGIVDLPLGPTGCPGCVENVERVFGSYPLRLNICRFRRLLENIVKEGVSVFLHRHLVPCVSYDDDLLHAGSFLCCFVCDLLELDEIASPSAAVSGDEKFGVSV